ncbi:MAG: DUF1636 domain-containing protein [Acaryochloridaceae cyanobacterium CSU_3_4]|nr:DUF1636 domain-containing protein [Acaryochloris sp. SU_5_25]NJN38824.1 DUF1636 domain-containing protein [Acaryochloridaceae cyanobacterium CSU_3_4]
MTIHTLFVCKSCSAVFDHEAADDLAEGNQLLLKLLEVQQANPMHQNLMVEPVGCLWTCDRPCAIAFSAPHKATYLFTNVPTTAASALLQFGELYRTSKTGDIPWKQFPEIL